MLKFQLAILTSCFVALTLAAPTKIDHGLRKTLQVHSSANILISFKAGTTAVLNSIRKTNFETREQRIIALTSALQANAAKSQKQLLQHLRTNSFEFEVLWISNQIYVKRADSKLIEDIAAFDEVFEIIEEEFIEIDKPIDFMPVSKTLNSAEWSIELIQAPEAWKLNGGNNGEGAVVATIDTGVRLTHEALRNNFLGQYGWFDAYYGTTEPNDENGHGTHTMGSIAGQGGIGVAPGSKWMTCKGCSGDWCTVPNLIRCGQFLICPTFPDGSNQDCSKAPPVISNSWGGGRGITNYHAVIDAWNAAGIIVVFSNGSSGFPGSSCNTANSPADHPDVIAVGSTTKTEELSPFSSVGPTYPDKLIKPDITAPGSEVVSAYNTSDNAYAVMSGTSMAGPHVAGVIALLKAHDRNLTLADIQRYLYAGTVKAGLISPGKNCGGIDDSIFPNHVFGHGRVNALESLKRLIAAV